MDTKPSKQDEDVIENSEHYSASSEDSDSMKVNHGTVPPQRAPVRKHKLSQSSKGCPRSSSEDSMLNAPLPPQPQQPVASDLYLLSDHPNFGLPCFVGNASGTEDCSIEVERDHKDQEILKLIGMIEELQKRNNVLEKEKEDQQRESVLKDAKIKQLEQTNKELTKKQKGGLMSQMRRRSNSNTTKMSHPLNNRLHNEA